MKTNNRCLILVADAHIRGGEQGKSFFRMLSLISGLPPDCAAVFLGDIFDLWLALPGYETMEQKRFLVWCRKEKMRRDVCFLEGNHEFFVASKHGKIFTCAFSDRLEYGDVLLVHGDRINRKDPAYAFLRLLLRNPISKQLIRTAAPGGFGPFLAWKIRYGLAGMNQEQKKHFPEGEAAARMEQAEKRGFRRIITGHFHSERHLKSSNGCLLDAMPPFLNKGEIGVYNIASKVLTTGPFEPLIHQIRSRKI